MRPPLQAKPLTSGQKSLNLRRQLQGPPGRSGGTGSTGAGPFLIPGLGGEMGAVGGLEGARGATAGRLGAGGGITRQSSVAASRVGPCSCCLLSIDSTQLSSSSFIGGNISSVTLSVGLEHSTWISWLEPRARSRPGGSPPLPVGWSHLLFVHCCCLFMCSCGELGSCRVCRRSSSFPAATEPVYSLEVEVQCWRDSVQKVVADVLPPAEGLLDQPLPPSPSPQSHHCIHLAAGCSPLP